MEVVAEVEVGGRYRNGGGGVVVEEEVEVFNPLLHLGFFIPSLKSPALGSVEPYSALRSQALHMECVLGTTCLEH